MTKEERGGFESLRYSSIEFRTPGVGDEIVDMRVSMPKCLRWSSLTGNELSGLESS